MGGNWVEINKGSLGGWGQWHKLQKQRTSCSMRTYNFSHTEIIFYFFQLHEDVILVRWNALYYLLALLSFMTVLHSSFYFLWCGHYCLYAELDTLDNLSIVNSSLMFFWGLFTCLFAHLALLEIKKLAITCYSGKKFKVFKMADGRRLAWKFICGGYCEEIMWAPFHFSLPC